MEEAAAAAAAKGNRYVIRLYDACLMIPIKMIWVQRDDRRRVSHNEVERRRRDKINNWILKLGKIMPDSVHNDTGKTGQVVIGAKMLSLKPSSHCL